MNFNRVIIGGHLTRDVELRFLPNGTAIAKFSLAVNEKWTNEAGQKVERACFIDCVHFGKRGEALAQYVKKGSPLLVEGQLQLETWDDKATGDKRSKHVIKVEDFEFCGGKEGK